MYQLTTNNEVSFFDSWAMLQEHLAEVRDDSSTDRWSVSMVLDAHEGELVALPENMSDEERVAWRSNAASLACEVEFGAQDTSDIKGSVIMHAYAQLPKTMTEAELFASILSLLSAYRSGDEAAMTQTLNACLATVPDMVSLSDAIDKSFKVH